MKYPWWKGYRKVWVVFLLKYPWWKGYRKVWVVFLLKRQACNSLWLDVKRASQSAGRAEPRDEWLTPHFSRLLRHAWGYGGHILDLSPRVPTGRAVCRNRRIKRVFPCRCRTGTLKNPTKCLWRLETDRSYNFFFSPPAHLCHKIYDWNIVACDVKHQ